MCGASDQRRRVAIESGFNSPFEEFAIAQKLAECGIPTVYVRAIYMTGTVKVEESTDLSRYESHKTILGRDGRPILQENHNYISIRGYFNGPDTWVAQQKGQLCRPVDLEKAVENGTITRNESGELYDNVLVPLKAVGYDGSFT